MASTPVNFLTFFVTFIVVVMLVDTVAYNLSTLAVENEDFQPVSKSLQILGFLIWDMAAMVAQFLRLIFGFFMYFITGMNDMDHWINTPMLNMVDIAKSFFFHLLGFFLRSIVVLVDSFENLLFGWFQKLGFNVSETTLADGTEYQYIALRNVPIVGASLVGLFTLVSSLTRKLRSTIIGNYPASKTGGLYSLVPDEIRVKINYGLGTWEGVTDNPIKKSYDDSVTVIIAPLAVMVSNIEDYQDNLLDMEVFSITKLINTVMEWLVYNIFIMFLPEKDSRTIFWNTLGMEGPPLNNDLGVIGDDEGELPPITDPIDKSDPEKLIAFFSSIM